MDRDSFRPWMDGFVAGGCVGMLLTILVVLAFLTSCVTPRDDLPKCDVAIGALFTAEKAAGGQVVSQGAGIDGLGVVLANAKAGTFRKFVITGHPTVGDNLEKKGYERVLQCDEPAIGAVVSVFRFIEPITYPEARNSLSPSMRRYGETVSPDRGVSR